MMSVSHPGETVKELFEENGIKYKVFADCYGFGVKYLQSVCAGMARLTPRFMAALEKEFGAPVLFWQKRQERYDQSLRC